LTIRRLGVIVFNSSSGKKRVGSSSFIEFSDSFIYSLFILRMEVKRRNMIGDGELLIIIIVTFFLFGPDKLPKIAKKIGKASGEFKKAYKEAEGELGEEIDEMKRLEDDFKN